MAAYDAEAFVGEALRSVLEQTHRDWELLVVDDGSGDRTAEIVSAIGDPRIRLLRLEHCGVLGAVRNAGLDATRGDAVALLDADDVWLPTKLERQLQVLEQRPEVGVVHTRADRLVDGRRQAGPLLPSGGSFVARLLESNFVYSSSVLIRRALLDEHGGFDPDPRLDGSPDFDLWLRLAPHTEFALVDEALLLYRVHAGQMSTGDETMQRSALVVLEKLAQRDPDLVRRHAAEYAFAVGMRRQLAGLPDRGRPQLLRSLRRRPWYRLAWRWLLRSLAPQRRATSA